MRCAEVRVTKELRHDYRREDKSSLLETVGEQRHILAAGAIEKGDPRASVGASQISLGGDL